MKIRENTIEGKQEGRMEGEGGIEVEKMHTYAGILWPVVASLNLAVFRFTLYSSMHLRHLKI